MRPSSADSPARWAAALRQTPRATVTAWAAASRSGVFTALRSSGVPGLLTPGLLPPALRLGVEPQVGGAGRHGVGHVDLGRGLAVIVGDVGRAARNEEALAG